MTLFCNFEGRDHYIFRSASSSTVGLYGTGKVRKRSLYTAPKAGTAKQCKTHKNHAPSPGLGVTTKYGGSILASINISTPTHYHFPSYQEAVSEHV